MSLVVSRFHVAVVFQTWYLITPASTAHHLYQPHRRDLVWTGWAGGGDVWEWFVQSDGRVEL